MKQTKPGGGKDGERDPLTLGNVTYGEDVKGNSTYDDTPEDDTAEKVDKTVAEQEERNVKANTPDAGENSRGAADPKSSEPAKAEGSDTPKGGSTETKN